MKKATLSNAIEALIPNEIFIISVIDGKEVVEYKNPDKAPSEKAINDKIAELRAEYEANQYQRNRAADYPSWQEQMDLLYHGGVDALKAELKKTKDKFPKPE